MAMKSPGAKDGLEAVNFYKADPSKYHIILMDHQMPSWMGWKPPKILKQSFNPVAAYHCSDGITPCMGTKKYILMRVYKITVPSHKPEALM